MRLNIVRFFDRDFHVLFISRLKESTSSGKTVWLPWWVWINYRLWCHDLYEHVPILAVIDFEFLWEPFLRCVCFAPRRVTAKWRKGDVRIHFPSCLPRLGTLWCSFPLTIYTGGKSCPRIILLLLSICHVVFGRCHIRIDDLRLFEWLHSQTNIVTLSLPYLTTITLRCPYHRFPPPRCVLRLNTPLHQPTLWSSNLPIEDLSSCYAGASRENPPHWRRRVPPGQKSQSSFFVPADSEMLFKRYSRNDHSSLHVTRPSSRCWGVHESLVRLRFIHLVTHLPGPNSTSSIPGRYDKDHWLYSSLMLRSYHDSQHPYHLSCIYTELYCLHSLQPWRWTTPTYFLQGQRYGAGHPNGLRNFLLPRGWQALFIVLKLLHIIPIGVTGGCTSRRNQPAPNPLFTVPVAFLSLTFTTMSTY